VSSHLEFPLHPAECFPKSPRFNCVWHVSFFTNVVPFCNTWYYMVRVSSSLGRNPPPESVFFFNTLSFPLPPPKYFFPIFSSSVRGLDLPRLLPLLLQIFQQLTVSSAPSTSRDFSLILAPFLPLLAETAIHKLF